MKRLSVVVVNLNSGSAFANTIDSILALDGGKEVEVVVVDGCSDDESSAALQRYRSSLDVLIVEQDRGIYDAMNKGLRAASGQWIWFVNAGDLVCISWAVLDAELRGADLSGEELLFSDLGLSTGAVVRQDWSLSYLMRSTLNHQNLLMRKCRLASGFDITYRYCADYAQLLSVYGSVKARKISEKLCIYDPDGLSGGRSRARRVGLWKERLKAQWGSPQSLLRRLVMCSSALCALCLKAVAPRLGSLRNL